MRIAKIAILTLLCSSPLMAKTIKTEVVEEQEKSEIKVFCSKTSSQDATNLCEKWLGQQNKSLGARLLTSHCSNGDMSSDTNCLYKATGEVKYMLKKYRTETERTD